MNERQTSPYQGAGGSMTEARGRIEDAAASCEAHAAAADTTGRLAAETVALLTRAGFARHFVPRVWNGTEGTFTELFAAVAAVGEGCASAAWCAALWATHAKYAAHLPLEGQRELWGESPDVRIAAGLRPSGVATSLPGGWLLSGTWECVSGITDADWLLLAAPAAGEPPLPAPGIRLFAVPAASVRIRRSWSSTGMRGTGSHTAVLEFPVVVPEHRTCALADVLAGLPGPGLPHCHTAPAYLGAGVLMCAPALGAARGALREWTAWAARTRSRTRPDGDRAGLHLVLAQVADDIEAAELLLRDAALRADSGTRAERDVARNRRVAAAAAHLLVTAVERLFREAGMYACGSPGPLERAWRDVHVLAAHQALRRETAATQYAASVFADLTPEAGAVADRAHVLTQVISQASRPADVKEVAGVH
ncbi:acyl-CoA dehydrogenase family protein [Streptomyces sp. NPDC092370]|uniref:acyl-CoA dehydrogenase family protein n=1 Tax=Streptomyces sp. NPDC092370 TaxID=3366016 RepID=UPI003828CC21